MNMYFSVQVIAFTFQYTDLIYICTMYTQSMFVYIPNKYTGNLLATQIKWEFKLNNIK